MVSLLIFLRRFTENAEKTPGMSTKNKTHLGCSIEEHLPCVDSRERFGDWELDLVVGSKSKGDRVLMTPLERKTRYYKIKRRPDRSVSSVMKAFGQLRNEYKEWFSLVLKTITTDNGSEFSLLCYTRAGF